MAKSKVTSAEVHSTDKYIEDLDISVDKIDDGLYLGNLACARDCKTLEQLQITHILTIDLVPLPRFILDRPNLTFEYLKLADVPKEDLISHLPETILFMKKAIADGGTLLVHCYFGVSRSAAVVVGYIMDKYGLSYDDALVLVKQKRRFVCPNIGFAAQLKLFGHMGCTLDRNDPRFKQFRLKMAGQKLKQVKILPQAFADLVKPDPGLIREKPDPIVYRCKKCRRIVASQENIIPHIPKEIKIELAKKGIRPQPSSISKVPCTENGQILIEKLKNLACQILDSKGTSDKSSDACDKSSDVCDKSSDACDKSSDVCDKSSDVCDKSSDADKSRGSQESSDESPGLSHSQKSDSYMADSDEGPSHPQDGYSCENMVEPHFTSRRAAEVCRLMWFVEPMSWMKGVSSSDHGKLHCPNCANKIGSFNWIMGCKCPCGQKVAPAFYLVPSKVEWSNIVQNVQITI